MISCVSVNLWRIGLYGSDHADVLSSLSLQIVRKACTEEQQLGPSLSAVLLTLLNTVVYELNVLMP